MVVKGKGVGWEVPVDRLRSSQVPPFARLAFYKILLDPTLVFNILWTDEAHFLVHGDGNTHSCHIWAMSNLRECINNPLLSLKITVWCRFTSTFVIRHFLFETDCTKKVENDYNECRKLFSTFTRDSRAILTRKWCDFDCNFLQHGTTSQLQNFATDVCGEQTDKQGLQVPVASSVSSFDTNKLLAIYFFKIACISIPSIQFDWTLRRDPARSNTYTVSTVALWLGRLCKSLTMCHSMKWWSCER